MRYLIQAMAMLSDLVIIGTSAILIYLNSKSIISWVLVIIAFKVWEKQGNFIAWKPENIKNFLQNMKKIGL